MINLTLNATLMDARLTGIGKYQKNVIQELASRSNLNLQVIINRDFKESNEGKLFVKEIKEINKNVIFKISPSNKYLFRLYSLLGIYLKKGYIYHDLSFNSALGRLSKAKIVTFHDAFFLDRKLWATQSGFPAFNAKYILPWSARNADHLVVQTEVVKKKLVEELNISAEKITVIPMGNTFEKKETVKSKMNKIIIKGQSIEPPYFLVVGAGHPRKRTSDVINASLSIDKKHTVVITGKEAAHEPGVLEAVQKNKNVILLNYVSDQELDHLYRNANALIFPSQEEGFGFPIIEGLSYHLPVIASDIDVFREIGSKFVNYFPVGDVKRISEHMNDILNNKSEIYTSIEIDEWLSKFTWENYVNGLVSIYSTFNKN